eukprot:1392538-Rhodomonas_salina.1
MGYCSGECGTNVSPYSCEYAPRNRPNQCHCAPLHQSAYSREGLHTFKRRIKQFYSHSISISGKFHLHSGTNS